MSKQVNSVDLIYVEGPGDIVAALKSWYKSEDFITETSKTFSGQVFDFSKKNNLSTLAISFNNQKKHISFDGFIAYNFPKKPFTNGISYHFSQLHNSLKIIKACVKHRPKYLHMTNGVTHLITLAPLKLLGIKITLQCHNTFWAKGYPPQSKGKKFWLKLDSWFLKNIASNVLCCSPEIKRQIETITKNKNFPIHIFKPQFQRKGFTDVTNANISQKPFSVVFAGRAEERKGIFDILAITENFREDPIVFNICGDGTDLARLQIECKQRALENKVFIHGRLDRPALLDVYQNGHVVIVPTRSDFPEGFAMVAAEAILMNRPIITSPIVPALELLKTAAIEVKSEDINSYTNAIKLLMSNETLYKEKQAACLDLKEQFLDGKQGLTNVLENTL